MTLEDKLWEYGLKGRYPFHMPGHKRNVMDGDSDVTKWFNEIHRLDITEISGFDNLHNAEGIILDLQNEMENFYGTKKTYPLVGGSTAGILSAITSCTEIGDEILVSRNCHKSVINACALRNLKPVYLSPEWLEECGIYGGILCENVDKVIKEHPKIKAAVIVSPTYEGVVSDIKAISDITKKNGIPLIVDEAHGAHFSYRGKDSSFPVSAVLYADIVIQSLHKTLPCMTQTALLHVNGDVVDIEKLEYCLQTFQSSSPSYIMMADISHCFHYMKNHPEVMEDYETMITGYRRKLEKIHFIDIIGKKDVGKNGIFDYDIGKLTIMPKLEEMTGKKLFDILQRDYGLELEMSSISYCIAMTSPFDTDNGLNMLWKALADINDKMNGILCEKKHFQPFYPGKQMMTPAEALKNDSQEVHILEAEGRISARNIYVYPPGSVFIAAGEIIMQDTIEKIMLFEKEGFEITGMPEEDMLLVVKG